MTASRRVLFEALVFLAVAAAAGLLANVLHPQGLDLGKNHFEQVTPDYQTMAAEELLEWSKWASDPDGGIVILDARRESQFQEGHIPGAVFCDPYNAGDWLPGLLPRLQAANTIVIYCTGGDCEDSKYMLRELGSKGIPLEMISIYEGGWEDWLERGYSVEKD